MPPSSFFNSSPTTNLPHSPFFFFYFSTGLFSLHFPHEKKPILRRPGKMKGGMIVTLLVVIAAMAEDAAGDAVGNDCANEFPKVTACLTFATGKADAPTQECCGSVSDLKTRKPVCLCYIIQQIHAGTNPQIKSMGIQEARLLQLPTACKLTNASSAECPKLLGLPPNSPDAAIFTGNSTSGGRGNATTPAAPAASSPPSSSSSPTMPANDKSSAHKQVASQPAAAAVLATLVVISFFGFPTGSLKLIHSM